MTDSDGKADERSIVRRYLEDYEFRFNGGGGHTPTDAEFAMLEDFGEGLVAEIEDERDSLRAQVKEQEAERDGAYTERNRLVAVLARIYPSGLKRTDIPGWLPEWHGCVYIDTPAGQMSWHYHDSDAHLFAGLPPYEGEWDGHTTEEKYKRLAALSSTGGSDAD